MNFVRRILLEADYDFTEFDKKLSGEINSYSGEAYDDMKPETKADIKYLLRVLTPASQQVLIDYVNMLVAKKERKNNYPTLAVLNDTTKDLAKLFKSKNSIQDPGANGDHYQCGQLPFELKKLVTNGDLVQTTITFGEDTPQAVYVPARNIEKKQLVKVTAELTAKETATAIRFWTNGGQKVINKNTGNIETYNPSTNDAKKISKEKQAKFDGLAANFLTAMKNLPLFKGTIYRGIRIPTKTLRTFLKKYSVGTIIKTDRFESTSKDLDMAQDFASRGTGPLIVEGSSILFVIKAKTAKDISQYAASQYKYQQEVLVTPGTTFKITDIEKRQMREWSTRKAYYITMKEI